MIDPACLAGHRARARGRNDGSQCAGIGEIIQVPSSAAMRATVPSVVVFVGCSNRKIPRVAGRQCNEECAPREAAGPAEENRGRAAHEPCRLRPKGRSRRETAEQKRSRRLSFSARLARAYPDAKCSLDYSSPLELLVATVLSAQCTDVRVNQTTPALFAKYRTAADYARAPAGELENDIRQTGFFNSKARSLRRTGATLAAAHGGRVPETWRRSRPPESAPRRTMSSWATISAGTRGRGTHTWRRLAAPGLPGRPIRPGIGLNDLS